MKEILFIVPPCHLDFNIDFEVAFPNHILYLMHYAVKAGWKPSFIDMTLEEKEGKNSFEVLEKELEEKSFDIVGISNHTVRTVPTTYEVANFIKARKNVSILVGGLNASFMWKLILEDNPNIDFIIKGFGQIPLFELLKSFPRVDKEEIPGFISKAGNKNLFSKTQPIKPEYFKIENLDFIDSKRYLEWTTIYTINTHFGCNYNCNFCTSTMPDKCQRKEVIRPVVDVIDEIQLAQKNGFESFLMTANNFTSDKEWLENFVDLVKKLKIGIEWSCMSRIEYIDEKVAKMLRAANCKNVAIGVESASSKDWNLLKKGEYTKGGIIRTFRLLRDNGIETTAFLIVGAPNQKVQDIDSTIELLWEINPDNRIVSYFQPYPGTPYWKNPSKFGLRDIDSFENWNFYEYPICETEQMSKNEIQEAAIRLYIDIGSGKSINMHEHYLSISKELKPYEKLMPNEVDYLFSVSKNYTIYDALKMTSKEYSTQAFVVCLYWLHYFFKNKIISYV